jgi:Na+/H+ antiporter NhaD/arsenite permease-like protein
VDRTSIAIIGAAAMVVTGVEEARASGIQIGFFDYCRVGVPITVVTLFVGWLVLIALSV